MFGRIHRTHKLIHSRQLELFLRTLAERQWEEAGLPDGSCRILALAGKHRKDICRRLANCPNKKLRTATFSKGGIKMVSTGPHRRTRLLVGIVVGVGVLGLVVVGFVTVGQAQTASGVAKSAWPMFRHDVRGTGCTTGCQVAPQEGEEVKPPVNGPQTATLKWVFESAEKESWGPG